ncbi:MAG TPA: hypothetical protein VF472_16270 [Burkholderiaceae bacterium]
MKARQLDIDIDDAEAGMVLACPLLDAHGGTLLPKGAELTASVLQSLHRRGVERVTIVDDSASEEELAKERERAGQRLAVLFRRASGQPGSEALRLAVLRYRTGEES